MAIKNNRLLSFIIVTIVYAIATAVGIIVYNALKLDFWLSLFIADVIATAVVFIFSVIFKNASVYDPYWSVQPMVIVLAFAVGQQMNITKIFIILAVFIWGIRLTLNWAYTFQNLNHQDWRYSMLKEKTGKFYPIINFIGIHLVPTIIVYACTLPIVFVMLSIIENSVWSIAFSIVSILAVVLQGVSDFEMHSFRKKKSSGFIREGLWKYSRHPNYLGEILMWWGIGLSSILALHGQWYLILGAILNNLLFLFVSIPLADGKQSKKDGFEEYKNETRMLLPIKKF